MKLQLLDDVEGIGKKDDVIEYDGEQDSYNKYRTIYYKLIINGKLSKIRKQPTIEYETKIITEWNGLDLFNNHKDFKQHHSENDELKKELGKISMKKLQKIAKKFGVNDTDKQELIAELITAGITQDDLKN